MLPTVWTVLDIRIIAFGAVAIIPVTAWILLGCRRGLLDVNRWCDWHGDDGGRIVIRVAVVRIRIKRCAKIKTEIGMAVAASPTIAPASAIAPASIISSTTIMRTTIVPAAPRPYRAAGYRPGQDDD